MKKKKEPVLSKATEGGGGTVVVPGPKQKNKARVFPARKGKGKNHCLLVRGETGPIRRKGEEKLLILTQGEKVSMRQHSWGGTVLFLAAEGDEDMGNPEVFKKESNRHS